MRDLFFLNILILFSLFSFGQESKIDSLIIEFKKGNALTKESTFSNLDSLIFISDTIIQKKAIRNFCEDLSLRKKNNELNNSYCLFLKGNFFYNKKEYITSKKYHIKALNLLEKIPDSIKLFSKINRRLWKTYYNLRTPDSSLYFLNKYSTSTKENKELFIMYHMTYNLFLMLGNNDRASKGTDKLTYLAKKLNDSNTTGYLYSHKAKVYSAIGNYEFAISSGLESIKYLKNPYGIAAVQKVVAGSYCDNGNPELSIPYYKSSVKFYRDKKSLKSLGVLLSDMADSYIKMNNYAEAEKVLLEALEIHQNIKRFSNLGFTYQRLGTLYFKMGKVKKAQEYSEKALELAQEYNINQLIKSVSKNLSEIYLKQKKYDDAYKYLNMAYVYSDSLLKENYNKQIVEISTKYETEKKEKELAEQKVFTQKQEILTQKANTRNWFLAFGLIALSISAFFIWKRYKSEAKAKLIISEQKTQIEKLQKEFHHRLKNDFRSINSYIGLVQRQFTDTNFKERLNELKNRVASMFKVHEILLQEDDITQVKAHPYLLELSQNVENKYNNENIKVICNVDKTETIVADKAVPFGIVLNEFVTNSYKYAFDDNGGEIRIDFESDADNHYLTLKDNGKGLPDDFNIENLRSLGMSIIPMFADLYDGNYQLDGSNGVSLTLTLPKKLHI